MRNGNIFLDEIFLERTWPWVIGLISQLLFSFVPIILIMILEGTILSVLQTEQLQRAIGISIFANVLNLIALFLEFVFYLRHYLFTAPIVSVRTFKEAKRFIKQCNNMPVIPIYESIFGLIFLHLITFIIIFISGVKWNIALTNSLLVILPFQIAFISICGVRIVFEVIYLVVRFIRLGSAQ